MSEETTTEPTARQIADQEVRWRALDHGGPWVMASRGGDAQARISGVPAGSKMTYVLKIGRKAIGEPTSTLKGAKELYALESAEA